MSYEKQEFKKGQKITPEPFNKMDDQLQSNTDFIENFYVNFNFNDTSNVFREQMLEYLRMNFVAEEIPCSGIIVSPREIQMRPGKKVRVTATKLPDNCNLSVGWLTSDPEIATVSGGIVTGISEGDCIITASCGGVTAECACHIEPAYQFTDGEIDLRNFVGYIPIDSMSKVFTLYYDFDFDEDPNNISLYKDDRTYLQHFLATTQSLCDQYHYSSPLGIIVRRVSETEKRYNVAEVFHDYPNLEKATAGAEYRPTWGMNNIGSDIKSNRAPNGLIMTNTAVYFAKSNANAKTYKAYGTTNGCFGKAMIFNARAMVRELIDKTDTMEIFNYRTNEELKQAMLDGFISPVISGIKLKRFILFNGVEYKTYEDVMANRSNAVIDLRINQYGEPGNAGTGADLIWARKDV